MSCQKDELSNVSTGRNVQFTVTELNRWNTTSVVKSRVAEDGMAENTSVVTDVLPLQGENPADTLFLHAMVTDGIESGRLAGTEPQTRATPVTDMETYGSFGVLTYAYTGSWNESLLPDYMYNVEVTKASSWTTSYYWPGGGHNVRFFAYAPYNGTGILLPDRSVAGTPALTYTVPAKVSDQKDLLVAASDEMAGNTTAAAPLTFKHALTAIRFIVGDDVLPGTITKITLKGVYGKATYPMGTSSWNDHDMIGDFFQMPDIPVDGTPGVELTSPEMTFMMIPQTLPADASIEVVWREAGSKISYVLTASVGGFEWPIGKTITYRISTSSISVIPEFAVTAPAEFTYAGGSHNYLVRSAATISRPGSQSIYGGWPWTAEFVEDDGNGGYTVIPRPEWLTNFTTSGKGSTVNTGYTATVSAQQGITSDVHNDALRAAAPVIGVYDLSTKGGTAPMQTANCYTINAPGVYSLPLVYGNAVDFVKNPADGNNKAAYTGVKLADGQSSNLMLHIFVNHLDAGITDPYIYNNANCTPADACLVWQDEQGLITNVALSADARTLTFEVPQASIKQGNAVVAVRDAAGTIMWSWHIWVTDYVPGLPADKDDYMKDKIITNYADAQFTMMPVNIGWCADPEVSHAPREVLVRFTQTGTGATQIITLRQKEAFRRSGTQTVFQWGRKDPMVPAAEGDVTKHHYSDAGYAYGVGQGKVSVGQTVQNPHMFYKYSGSGATHWCKTNYYNLWDAGSTQFNAGDRRDNNMVVKSIYDPSPVGYCLPPTKAFTGFTFNGANTASGDWAAYNSSMSSPEKEIEQNFGIYFFCNKMPDKGTYDTSGGVIFFPGTGLRRSFNGVPNYSAKLLEYWLAHGGSSGYYMSHQSGLTVYASLFPAHGMAVRPMKEQ